MEAVTKFRKKWLTCRIIEMPGTFSPRTPPDSKVFAWKLIADGWSSLTFIEDSTVKIKREWLKFIVFSLANSSFDPSAYRLFILMTLLRNICGLALPVTGWDVLPAATDLSREADIARVKYFRNTVYTHAEHASIDDATFNTHWKEIRDTLVRLGRATYKVK